MILGVFVAAPILKTIAIRVVIVLLRHLASRTDNMLDDKIVDTVELAVKTSGL